MAIFSNAATIMKNGNIITHYKLHLAILKTKNCFNHSKILTIYLAMFHQFLVYLQKIIFGLYIGKKILNRNKVDDCIFQKN